MMQSYQKMHCDRIAELELALDAAHKAVFQEKAAHAETKERLEEIEAANRHLGNRVFEALKALSDETIAHEKTSKELDQMKERLAKGVEAKAVYRDNEAERFLGLNVTYLNGQYFLGNQLNLAPGQSCAVLIIRKDSD